MSVSAIIVTRGDQDLTPVLAALPSDWEVLVWDNGANALYEGREEGRYWNVSDLSVYGRYAAIEYASSDLIYVQDDDCVVEDPAYIVDTFITAPPDAVICNMPQEFRHGFYEEHALVGFGAAFHRDAPVRAFARMRPNVMASYGQFVMSTWLGDALVPHPTDDPATWPDLFHRTCDVVFTALTPRVLVDVPYENLPWAESENRMYRQPGHVAERAQMLELAFRAKDAT